MQFSDTHSTGTPRLGLSTTSLPESLSAIFDAAGALGYDGVEWMVGVGRGGSDIDVVASLADRYDMPVLSVHAPCLVYTFNVWGRDPKAKLMRTCQAALRLGAPLVVCHPPLRWQRQYAGGFVDWVRHCYEETGIVVAVENMYPWGTTRHVFDAYLPDWDPSDEDYDALTLDLSHAATARMSALGYVASWGDRLRHVHLTDGRGSMLDEHLFPGDGNQRAWDVVAELGARGYSGSFVVEVNTHRMGDPDERRRRLAETARMTREQCERGRTLASVG